MIIMLTSPLGQSMEAKPYGSAQAEVPTEEFATAEAMRRMPTLKEQHATQSM